MKWWPKLRRAPLPANVAQSHGHAWTYWMDGPRRCKRCYEREGGHLLQCSGRPTPIVIDTGVGRACDG